MRSKTGWNSLYNRPSKEVRDGTQKAEAWCTRTTVLNARALNLYRFRKTLQEKPLRKPMGKVMPQRPQACARKTEEVWPY